VGDGVATATATAAIVTAIDLGPQQPAGDEENASASASEHEENVSANAICRSQNIPVEDWRA
jgi:hypothetical protein